MLVNMTRQYMYMSPGMRDSHMLCCISKSIVSRTRRVIGLLCLALVKLHLEYCVQNGLPSVRKTLTKWNKSVGRPPR